MHATTGNPADVTDDIQLATTSGDATAPDITEPGSTQTASEAGRRMIAVSDLIAHPGNVRENLHALSRGYTASTLRRSAYLRPGPLHQTHHPSAN